jgi:hypothetical protein
MIYAKIENPEQEKRLIDELKTSKDKNWYRRLEIITNSTKGVTVKEIIDHYDARKHPIFSTLIESGPIGLAKEAVDFGYVMKKDYADKCHLCQEARNVLQVKYPDYLVPIQHYRFLY